MRVFMYVCTCVCLFVCLYDCFSATVSPIPSLHVSPREVLLIYFLLFESFCRLNRVPNYNDIRHYSLVSLTTPELLNLPPPPPPPFFPFFSFLFFSLLFFLFFFSSVFFFLLLFSYASHPQHSTKSVSVCVCGYNRLILSGQIVCFVPKEQGISRAYLEMTVCL